MSFIKSKHSGWTWELKRTPFGGGGGSFRAANAPASQTPAADPHNAPQAPARDIVKETMQQRMQAAQPQQAPVQQAAPVSNPYQAAFYSQQMNRSPLVQQQLMRQQPQQMYSPQQISGLQAAMMQLMGRYNQPMMRSQMPQYSQQQRSPLAYRPDISNAQTALNNVAPSVELQQRRAAEEAARLQAEQDAYNAANPQPSPYDYGGGG